MAMAFQKMLERFGLMDKIHAVNADNASPNDKQMTKLAVLDNSFEKDNHVRCFNHTMQLSAKTLLVPFNTAISQKATQDDEMPEEDDDQLILEGDDEDEDDAQGSEDEDDGIDELDELSESERAGVLKSTAVVRETVTKVRNHETKNVRILGYITDCWLSKQVRQLAFAIIHSTTITHPAWCRTCSELNLKKRLIPRDIVTQWNSTYDMMCFVLTYRKAVDQITANKVLKLRRYELDNDNWVIIEDLVSVLEVRSSVVRCACYATYITDTFFTYRNIKKPPYSSLKIQ